MPDNDISSLILVELRELRSDHNEQALKTAERLSALEASMRAVIGNGQKGRLTLLEEAVDKLKEFRWWLVGVSAGAGAVGSVVLSFILPFLH